jgi:hypothetical protein
VRNMWANMVEGDRVESICRKVGCKETTGKTKTYVDG